MGMYYIDESPHTDRSTRMFMCMCVSLFSQLWALTDSSVWLWGVWDCIQIFLAHSAIIIIGVNIVIWSWVLWPFSFYHLRKRMHLVTESAIEKNPKILCVCFSVLVYLFLFFWASVSLDEWGDQFEWVYQQCCLFLYSETPVFSLPLLQ